MADDLSAASCTDLLDAGHTWKGFRLLATPSVPLSYGGVGFDVNIDGFTPGAQNAPRKALERPFEAFWILLGPPLGPIGMRSTCGGLHVGGLRRWLRGACQLPAHCAHEGAAGRGSVAPVSTPKFRGFFFACHGFSMFFWCRMGGF